MGDEFRQIRAGEAVEVGHPIVSTKRNNVLTSIAKERLGGNLPVRGKIPLTASVSEGSTNCGTLEINTRGGLHFRLDCGTSVSPWVSIPATFCEDENLEVAAIYPPTGGAIA